MDEEELAVLVAIGGGAERGGKIFRAPAHRGKARRRRACIAAMSTAAGVSVATGKSLIVAVRQAVARFAGAIMGVEHDERGRAIGLGHDEAGGRGCDNRLDIGIEILACPPD